MRIVRAHPLWVVLFLLLSALSSDPVGSLEQGASSAPVHVVPASLAPAPRVVGKLVPTLPRHDAHQADNGGARRRIDPPVAPPGVTALPGKILAGSGYAPGPRAPSPRRESFPYDANPPPVGV